MEENTSIDISAVNEKIAQESAFIDLLMLEMNKVIVGQIINWSLRTRTYFIGRCSWFSKNTSNQHPFKSS
jgi:hypothetical protein